MDKYTFGSHRIILGVKCKVCGTEYDTHEKAVKCEREHEDDARREDE